MTDPQTHDRRAPGVVLQIQYLRAAAALMVVFHHARNPAPWLYNPAARLDFAVYGVDIFFVISGFIIFTAARGEGLWDFARRRFIRVAPLYWLATLAYLWIKPADWVAREVDLMEIVKSMAFIPFANPTYDGQAWPILVPGWTLNLEMFFYALFGLGLAARRPVTICAAVIAPLVLIGLVAQPVGPVAATYTSFRMLEFVGGLGLGLAYARWPLKRYVFLFPAGAVALVATEWVDPAKAGPLVLAASLALVAGALALEQRIGPRPIGWLKRLGDASYSLYLTHTLTLILLLKVFKRQPLEGWLQFAAFMGTTMIASVLVALVVHATVEKPLLALLSRLVKRRRSTGPAMATG